MAVKDEDQYNPSENLILAHPRRHYRTSIKGGHWQLRSLVGSEKQNLVYFPTGPDNRHIQRLNTATNEIDLVKILPFQPRCLTARKGWICCGGETGEFASVCLDEDDNLNLADRAFRLPSEPDARLPIDLDSSRLDDSVFSILARSRSNKALVAESKRFGRQRVNCVTLWFPPSRDDAFEGAYNRPVAVLANNDKTVTVVALRDQSSLDEVTYPDCVNRAVVSPDGRLLIAICDDPYLYVHERLEKPVPFAHQPTSVDRPVYEWVFCTRIHLKSQKKGDRTDNRGSFAACFSNLGTYLAVGTQYGTISIFDVNSLRRPEMDPLITCFTSSRPNSDPGAIRDMAFAPGPIDLLAWTEDRGRVGVADLKGHFVSRQILHLDKPDTYDHISVIDKSSIDPRLLDQRSERRESPAPNLASGPDLSLGNRREPTGATPNVDHLNEPLRPDETAVLEAVQASRRRFQRPGGPLDRSIRSTLGSDASRSRDRSASVSRAVNEIMGNNTREQTDRPRDGASSRLLLTDRPDIDSSDRHLSGGPPPPPRRAGEPPNASTTSESEAPRTTRRALSRPNPAPLTGWVDLELLQDLPYSTLLPTDGESRYRDRSALLTREWEDNPYRRYLGLHATRTRPDPHDTAGLSWSEDGQTLFVGADNGIYEFRVNCLQWKLLSSIVMH